MSTRAGLLGFALTLWSCGGAVGGNEPGTAGSDAQGVDAAGSDVGGLGGGGRSSGAGGRSNMGGKSGGGGEPGTGGKSGASGSSGTGGSGGGQGSGGAGGRQGSGGTAGSTGSGGASSMADVQALFDARCVLCHDKSKQGLPTFPQLSLVASDAHAALVNKAATEACGGILVVPGDPDHSYLWHKLTDVTPCSGAPMPRPFEVIKPPPFTAAQLTTIRSWISAGAKP